MLCSLWPGLDDLHNSADAPAFANAVSGHYSLTAQIVECSHALKAKFATHIIIKQPPAWR